MSFIPCTNECKYQKDGVCTLEIALFNRNLCEVDCIHYVPKADGKYDKFENKKKQSFSSQGFRFFES